MRLHIKYISSSICHSCALLFPSPIFLAIGEVKWRMCTNLAKKGLDPKASLEQLTHPMDSLFTRLGKFPKYALLSFTYFFVFLVTLRPNQWNTLKTISLS